jgi:hypothetical protein
LSARHGREQGIARRVELEHELEELLGSAGERRLVHHGEDADVDAVLPKEPDVVADVVERRTA